MFGIYTFGSSFSARKVGAPTCAERQPNGIPRRERRNFPKFVDNPHAVHIVCMSGACLHNDSVQANKLKKDKKI
jgi:hypothetical protein